MTSAARISAAVAAALLAAACSGPAAVDPPASPVLVPTTVTAPAITESSARTTPASASSVIERLDGLSMFSCIASDAVQLFQWDFADSVLSGTLTTVRAVGSAPQRRTSSEVSPVAGTISQEGSVSISVRGGPQVFGSITPAELALQVTNDAGEISPLKCAATDPDGWNAVIADLRGSVELDNSAAADAIADRNLQDQISRLQSDIAARGSRIADAARALDSDVTLSAAIDEMKVSLSAVQSAAAEVSRLTTCSYDDAIHAAESVGYDADSVSYDRDSLDYDIDALGYDAQSIQDDAAGIQADVSALDKLGVAPPADTEALIAVGNDAISRMQDAATAARSTGDELLATARKLASQSAARAAALCG